MFFRSLNIAGQHLIRLIQRAPGVWLLILMTSALMSMIMDYYTSEIQAQTSSMMFVGLGLAVLCELLISMTVMIFAALHLHDLLQGLPKNTSLKTLGAHLRPLTIESLRSLTRMLLWSLLFVLPGLYQMLKLSFVNFVVLFDRRYANGQIDALAESGVETKGLKRYLALLLITSFAVELFADWVRKSFMGESILSAVAAATVKLIFDIFSQGAIYALYASIQTQQRASPSR